MDGVDVQRFISDQRSRLSQEKARLFENEGSPRGIIPSGSQMSKRSELLRQERHAEYQNFLESRKKAPKSIAEIRREMAREREQEIRPEISTQSATNSTSSTSRQTQDQSSTVSDGYASIRNRKREEERQYRGATYYDNGSREESEQRARRRWNDEAPPPSTHQRVRFEERRGGSEITNRGYSQGWEEDERELMTWARSGGGNRHTQGSRNGESRNRQHLARARTPPEVESPRKRVDQDAQKLAKTRSISAPVVHDHDNGGIFGLGGREDSAETKRNKQKEYAEVLRAQIKEREEAKERERVREEMMEVRDAEDEKPSLRNKSSGQISRKSERDEKEKYHYEERLPPPQRRDHDQYPSYQPPPSRFNDYPPYYDPPYNWDSHYYPYYPPQPPLRGNPNFNYYPPDPYHNPYYHPSHRFPPPPPPPHMRGENPYFPSHHEFEHGPPQRRHWENYEDEYPTKSWKKGEYESKRSRDLSSRDKRNPEETSPLHGGGGSGQRGVAMDKAAYRAELTRQMKEKKQNELKAKLKREVEDSKKEMEVYDPFGKGGCGAPVRDQHGNLVADLKQMRKINQERLNLSTSPSHRPASSGAGGGGDQPSDSPRTILTYDKVDQEAQKQAGHMTYRDFLRQQVEEKEKKKEEEKKQQMMEEQRELERLEKERKKLEEDFKRERERERQREEEAKRKNEQLKREAEEKKRQAALQAEEEQRKETERERQLAEAKLRALAERMAQPLPPHRRTYSPPIPTLRNKDNRPPPQASVVAQEQSQTVVAAQEEGPAFRSTSPPVPAVLKKMAQEKQIQAQSKPKESTAPQIPARVGTNSPPPSLQTQRQPSSSTLLPSSMEVPRHDHPRDQATQPLPTTSTATIQPAASTTIATGDQPSDILKQLAAMRMHLQSELVKKDAMQQRSDHAGVFGRARQQRPKMPGPRIARPKDSATLNALNQFTHLKYTNPSRGDFVSKYPDLPDTESVLELQQDALLRHQEQQLSSLKAGKERDRSGGVAVIKQRRHQPLFDGDPLTSDSLNLPISDKNDPFQLPSTSQGHMTVSMATIGGGTKVPDHTSVVGRRRQWGEEGRVPSPGGQSQFSVTTFDMDSMARRTDERVRRLDAILNAGTSGTVNHSPQRGGQQHLKNHRQDPQTILHDFLRKTDHRRGGGSRQSERSLDCETNYQRISSPHT